MLSALGRFLDTQVLQGSGASGQLIGVCNWPGIAVQSGTSLAFGGLTTMRQTVTVADAPPEQLAWIATPIVAELMRNEMKVSGDYSPCWEDNGTMLGYPAYATTTMPAGTLLLGAWGQVVLGLFGPGFLLEIDPFSGFKTGVIGARMIVTADVAVMRIGTFMVASGVT
jgi:hypothetical protein